LEFDMARRTPNQIDALGELPPAPAYLGDIGRLEWQRTGALLIAAGTLSETDLAVLAVYCLNLDLLVRAQGEIERNGMTIEGVRGRVRNPALAVVSGTTAAIRSLASELGLTPKSRARVAGPAEDADDVPTLDELLGVDDGVEDAA
jgi:P27 family predicted phage terminase small subunit